MAGYPHFRYPDARGAENADHVVGSGAGRKQPIFVGAGSSKSHAIPIVRLSPFLRLRIQLCVVEAFLFFSTIRSGALPRT